MPRLHRSIRLLHASHAVLAAALWAALATPAAASAALEAPVLPADADIDDLAADDDSADRRAIVVTATRPAAEKALGDVPGGTGFIDQTEVTKGRVLTNEDVLAFQPGVFAQAAGGSDGLKISVRGSAINRGVNFFRTGILFSFDGLPVTGPGGTPYELFEPLGLKYTEVLRGANGFDRGSSYLGGAINYVTLTGKDASLLEARVEGGSFGYQKGQIASGGQFGNIDYYVSAVYSQRDGYQKQSAGDAFGLIGNVGIQLTPDIDTRFFFRYRKTWNQTPGALLISEISGNPRTANPQNIARNAVRIQPGSTWIGNKTNFQLDDRSKLTVGFTYHDYPIDIETQNSAVWAYTDLAANVDYERTDTLFGRDSVTRFGILSVDHTRGWQRTTLRYTIDPGTGSAAPSGLPAGSLLRFATYDGADRNFHLSNTSEPAPGLKVTLGAALLNIYRATEVTYPVTNKPFSRNSWDYTARFGLEYESSPDLQVYGNVSRSVEPPNDWSFLTTPPQFTSGPAKTLASQAFPLKDQTAWTVELGARGKAPVIGNWNISAYRAWVRNESLSVLVDLVNNITAEANASPTIHQGIEVGQDAVLWRSKNDSGTNIAIRNSYTFNDFRFEHDTAWGRNQLPSLPKHFYQGQLTFNHASGAYLTAETQIASGYPVDYANTLHTRPYAIFGATVGYAPQDGNWSAFIDAHNIGNKGYAAAVSPIYNAKGIDTRVGYPGDGFSLVAGISVKLGK